MSTTAQDFLNELEKTLADLLGYPISVEIMGKKEKEKYWGYSLERYVTDGRNKFCKTGLIRLDSKVDDEKLRDIIVHEAKHLSSEKLNEETIRKSIEGIDVRRCISEWRVEMEQGKKQGKDDKIIKLDIRKEPIYFDLSRQWFRKAKRVKKAIFYRFFCLWNSFNALYNLVGDYETKDVEKILFLVAQLKEKDASFILKDAKKNCDFFMLEREPVKDMQKVLFRKPQPDDVIGFEHIRRKYLNRDVPNTRKLKYIVHILYRVRNNLTHGSKEVSGMDKRVITNAVPISENLVDIITKKVFDKDC